MVPDMGGCVTTDGFPRTDWAKGRDWVVELAFSFIGTEALLDGLGLYSPFGSTSFPKDQPFLYRNRSSFRSYLTRYPRTYQSLWLHSQKSAVILVTKRNLWYVIGWNSSANEERPNQYKRTFPSRAPLVFQSTETSPHSEGFCKIVRNCIQVITSKSNGRASIIFCT